MDSVGLAEFPATIGFRGMCLYREMDGKKVLTKPKPGSDGAPAAAAAGDGTSSPNAELVEIFKTMVDHFFKTGVASEYWYA